MENDRDRLVALIKSGDVDGFVSHVTKETKNRPGLLKEAIRQVRCVVACKSLSLLSSHLFSSDNWLLLHIC